MDKKVIIEKIYQQLTQDRAALFDSYETHRQASIEAPSRMQSRYDSSREELGRVADATARRLQALDRLIATFQQIENKRNDRVQLGSLVQIEEDEKTFYILIVPEGAGGQSFKEGNEHVQSVAITSPMGRAFLSKEVGDDANVKLPAGVRTLSIINIE